jgi:hypothetical protein
MPQPEQSGGQPPLTHEQKLIALHEARDADIALRSAAMFGGRRTQESDGSMAFDFSRRGTSAADSNKRGRRGPATAGALLGLLASAAGFGALATTHQSEPQSGRTDPVIVTDTRPTRGPGVVILPPPTESSVPSPTSNLTTPSQAGGEQIQPKPETSQPSTPERTPMYEKSEVPPEGMWLYSQRQIVDEFGKIDHFIGFTNFVTRFNLYLAPSGKKLSPGALRELYEHRQEKYKGAFDAVNGRSDMEPNVDRDNAAVFQAIEAKWEEQTRVVESATSTNGVAKAVDSTTQAQRTAALERARAVSKSVGNFFTSQRRIRARSAYA